MDDPQEVKKYSKPISYDALKAILDKSDFQTRTEWACVMPEIRVANRTVPYTLDKVHISNHYFKVNDASWSFGDAYPERSTFRRYEAIPGKCVIRFHRSGKHIDIKVNVDKEETMRRIVTYYIRKGTHIKNLTISHVPTYLDRNLNLTVEEYDMDNSDYQCFDQVKPLLHKVSRFNRVKFVVRTESLKLLEEPLVKSATWLSLQFPYYDTIDFEESMLQLNNKELYIIHLNYPLENVYQLGMNWLSSQREIGSKFWLTIECYTFVVDAIELFESRCENSFRSKVVSLEDKMFCHSLAIPVNDKSVLVIFGGPMIENWNPFNWTFRMEIMDKNAVVAKVKL